MKKYGTNEGSSLKFSDLFKLGKMLREEIFWFYECQMLINNKSDHDTIPRGQKNMDLKMF